MDFGEVLTKAWKIIWKHKILWLFGILAGCMASGSGAGGGGGGGGNAVYSGGQSESFGGPNIFVPSMQRAMQDFFEKIVDIPVWVWILIAILMIVFVFILSFLFLMAGTLGTAGVIKGASMADQAAADAKPLSFGTIFKAVKPYYWKVFLLNLGLRISGFLLVLIFIIPIILLTVCTCFLGLFLLIPIAWLVELMIYFTTIAVIEENKGIFDAISRAWQLIIAHLGEVFLMFLILEIGQLIAGIVIVVPLFVVPLPILINLLFSGFETIAVGLIISLVLFLMMIPFVIFLTGVLRAYVLAGWTLTYRRFLAEQELETVIITDAADEDELP